MTRCGVVSLVGRPNVGKSTLINRVLGVKVSITSRRPQTTRNRILGIKTTPHGQLIVLDTPGLHTGEGRALNRAMNRAAMSALEGVDLVVVICEAMRFTAQDEFVLDCAKRSDRPLVLVVNKVDLVKDKSTLLPFLAEVNARASFLEVLPLSARRERDAQRFEQTVMRYLPEREPMFSDDEFTDRSSRFMCAELIREKLARQLGDELPHRIAVEIVSYKPVSDAVEIDASIWVESDGQKAIVIGKQGARLKEVGTQARRDIERLIDAHVRLSLWVKVKSGWSNSERWLAELGYAE